MTEHEDLIARLRAVVDVALMDASAASSEFDCSESDYRATEAHCRELEAVRDEMIAALEKVTVERDNWKLSAEEAERAEKRAEKRAEEAERERDATYAVVERVRMHAKRLSRRNDLPSGQALGITILDDLSTVPADAPTPPVALDRVKAEALREAADYLDSFEGPGGRQSAHDRAGRDIIRLIRVRAEHIETEGDR